MIKIVTDSTAALPSDLCSQFDITVVPLHVIFGQRSYRDGVDLTSDEFYQLLRESKDTPSTTQPSVGEFLETYRPLAEAGHTVISIHLASKLSGTYSSAIGARDMLAGADITPFDSAWTSFALGMIVREAAIAAQAGKSKEEIVALVERLNGKLNLLFVVDTLEYLQRGGRIGGAQALLGSLLRIKPILALDEGRIEPIDKVRTKPAAIRRLLEIMARRVDSTAASLRVAVMHAGAPEEAQALGEEIHRRFGVNDFFTGDIGPAISTHTGPGTVGVAFYVANPEG
jgi:DegV family protein with EDD domain